jgi:hypothetical protein
VVRNPSTKKNKKNTEIILCFKKLSYIWSVETMKRKQQEKKNKKKNKKKFGSLKNVFTFTTSNKENEKKRIKKSLK